MHQGASVNPIESRTPPFSEPNLKADLARQTVEEWQALALPVVRAEKGLLELFFESICVGQVKCFQIATFIIDQDKTQCSQDHLTFTFKCAHTFNF